MTRTQSALLGEVKLLFPEFANDPIDVAFPFLGSNHHAFAELPAIDPIFTVTVLLVGIYAAMKLPSLALATAA
jgi:hypothetical protein